MAICAPILIYVCSEGVSSYEILGRGSLGYGMLEDMVGDFGR